MDRPPLMYAKTMMTSIKWNLVITINMATVGELNLKRRL